MSTVALPTAPMALAQSPLSSHATILFMARPWSYVERLPGSDSTLQWGGGGGGGGGGDVESCHALRRVVVNVRACKSERCGARNSVCVCLHAYSCTSSLLLQSSYDTE
jgi:hypothetical protein